MKKRLISLLLTLAMVFGIVPMLGIGVGAAYGVNHRAENDTLCDLVPYAYRASLFSSTNYYITHHNIQRVYNADALERQYNNLPTTAIFNSIENANVWNSISLGCREILVTVFDFDCEFTQQDLYDSLLINMILERVVEEYNADNLASDLLSKVTNVLNATVSIVDSAGENILEVISLHQF